MLRILITQCALHSKQAQPSAHFYAQAGTYELKFFADRTNEVQVANTYSERQTEVEIFQYNGKKQY